RAAPPARSNCAIAPRSMETSRRCCAAHAERAQVPRPRATAPPPMGRAPDRAGQVAGRRRGSNPPCCGRLRDDYSLISPRLMLAPRRASTDFLFRPFADISRRYVPEPSSSLSNLKSPYLSLVVSATVRPSLLRRTPAPSTQSTTPFVSAASVPPMKHFE